MTQFSSQRTVFKGNALSLLESLSGHRFGLKTPFPVATHYTPSLSSHIWCKVNWSLSVLVVVVILQVAKQDLSLISVYFKSSLESILVSSLRASSVFPSNQALSSINSSLKMMLTEEKDCLWWRRRCFFSFDSCWGWRCEEIIGIIITEDTFPWLSSLLLILG